ncbi:hypothetical protein NW768_001027 [Fusarium equiseti]|uniref:Uncharacterized protein n=1 Tax=Fusarium equiseti TaxID=61235 RepID=A0ABQ8RPB6_FUSEQ|nr:hypothetical protein NW768_001027 [Fusarium equiseti]
MRPSIIHSITLGLASLAAVEGSACKPRSQTSGLSSIASTTQIDTTTTQITATTETLDTSTSTVESVVTDSTATTESTVITEPTTTEESTTTAESTATTDVTVTTDATASSEATSVTETTEAPSTIATTTTEATTTTAEPEPPMTTFTIIASGGEVSGMTMSLSRTTPVFIFDSRSSEGFSLTFFTVDPTNGQLLSDGTRPVCAYYSTGGSTVGVLRPCDNPPNRQEDEIVCEPPARNGDTLRCSAPGTSCGSSMAGINCVRLGVDYDMPSVLFNAVLNKYISALGAQDSGMTFKAQSI